MGRLKQRKNGGKPPSTYWKIMKYLRGKAIKNGYVGKGVVYGISIIHSKAIPFLTCLSRATPQIHGYLWKLDQHKWMQKPLTARMMVRIITTNHQHVAFATAVAHLCAWTWDFIVFFFFVRGGWKKCVWEAECRLWREAGPQFWEWKTYW